MTLLSIHAQFRDEVIRNYEERRSKPDSGALCDEDIELLKNWRWYPNITEDRGGDLTGQGWDDLKFLALNYQSAYPRLLENIYSPPKFRFRYTTSDRTNASLKGFLEGLFGDHAYDHISAPAPLEKDMLLKPYEECAFWKKNQAKNKDDDDSEANKFEEGPQYQKMIDDVSKRLGFKLTLSKKQVKLIYDMCRYDQAWSLDRPSAWCTAFTKSQIQVLEYAQDLKYYRETGYGNTELNANVACETVKDLLRSLDSKDNPVVSAYFAHSSTIQLFLTALDTYRDAEPLRADNFAEQSRRKWRVSEISPFAANVAAIKYDCPNDNERTKVMFFLNQRPMAFPYCNVGLCNWSDVKRMYQRFDGADCANTFCRSKGSKIKHHEKATVGALTLAALGVIGQYF